MSAGPATTRRGWLQFVGAVLLAQGSRGHAAAVQPPGPVVPPWWTSVEEPGLRRWIDTVLQHNPEGVLGRLRLAEAGLRLQRAALQLRPVFSVAFGARLQDGDDTMPPRAVTGALGVQFTPDLWGRGQASVAALTHEQAAVMADEQALQLALSTTAAAVYWQRLFTLEAWRQAQASHDIAHQVLQLVELQQRLGKVSSLELAQARADLEAQALRLQQLQLALQEHRLSARRLLGEADTGSDSLSHDSPGDPVPPVPPALPDPATAQSPPLAPVQHTSLDALRQRPDLQAAASRLQRLARERDLASLATRPSFDIGASLTRTGLTLLDALQRPAAALSAVLTLFESRIGEQQNITALADNALQQATVAYGQALQQALMEVQAVLQRQASLQAQDEVLQRLLAQHQESERVYALRYRLGAVELRVWLDAQERVRAAQSAWLDNRLARHLNHLDWIRAVGGASTPTPSA